MPKAAPTVLALAMLLLAQAAAQGTSLAGQQLADPATLWDSPAFPSWSSRRLAQRWGEPPPPGAAAATDGSPPYPPSGQLQQTPSGRPMRPSSLADTPVDQSQIPPGGSTTLVEGTPPPGLPASPAPLQSSLQALQAPAVPPNAPPPAPPTPAPEAEPPKPPAPTVPSPAPAAISSPLPPLPPPPVPPAPAPVQEPSPPPPPSVPPAAPVAVSSPPPPPPPPPPSPPSPTPPAPAPAPEQRPAASNATGAGGCQLEPGTDLFGGDLGIRENVGSADDCCRECQRTSGCGAFTWGFNEGRNRCFLKQASGWSRRQDPALTSGVVKASAAPSGSPAAANGSGSGAAQTIQSPEGSCSVEPGTNFLYSDLAVKEGVNSAIACCALCHTTPPCGAWTWGFSADRNKCFLKFKTGWSRDLDPKLTSGVVL